MFYISDLGYFCEFGEYQLFPKILIIFKAESLLSFWLCKPGLSKINKLRINRGIVFPPLYPKSFLNLGKPRQTGRKYGLDYHLSTLHPLRRILFSLILGCQSSLVMLLFPLLLMTTSL